MQTLSFERRAAGRNTYQSQARKCGTFEVVGGGELALRDYNAYIGLFPNYLFARWAGFERNENYFEAAAASREAPKVQFPSAPR